MIYSSQIIDNTNQMNSGSLSLSRCGCTLKCLLCVASLLTLAGARDPWRRQLDLDESTIVCIVQAEHLWTVQPQQLMIYSWTRAIFTNTDA
jgi:hypothetical protein